MSRDVIAQIGQIAGQTAREQRFAQVATDNSDLIKLMAKTAANIMPMLGQAASATGKFMAGRGGRTLLGAGAGAGAGAVQNATMGDADSSYWKPMLAGAGAGAVLGAGGRKALMNSPLFSKAAPMALPHPTTGATAFRQFAPGRAAATLGVATPLAALGAGHLSDQATRTSGSQFYNPFTWGGLRNSEEDVFRDNNRRYSEGAASVQKKMNDAVAEGDHETATKLYEQLSSGNFGGNWRLLGLNPLGGHSGRTYSGAALGAQSKMQGKYDKAMGNVGAQAGDFAMIDQLRKKLRTEMLLPAQAQALKKQLEALETRVRQDPGQESDKASGIRRRMEAIGMNFRPFGTPQRSSRPYWGLPGGELEYNYGRRMPPQSHDPGRARDWAHMAQRPWEPGPGQSGW